MYRDFRHSHHLYQGDITLSRSHHHHHDRQPFPRTLPPRTCASRRSRDHRSTPQIPQVNHAARTRPTNHARPHGEEGTRRAFVCRYAPYSHLSNDRADHMLQIYHHDHHHPQRHRQPPQRHQRHHEQDRRGGTEEGPRQLTDLTPSPPRAPHRRTAQRRATTSPPLQQTHGRGGCEEDPRRPATNPPPHTVTDAPDDETTPDAPPLLHERTSDRTATLGHQQQPIRPLPPPRTSFPAQDTPTSPPCTPQPRLRLPETDVPDETTPDAPPLPHERSSDLTAPLGHQQQPRRSLQPPPNALNGTHTHLHQSHITSPATMPTPHRQPPQPMRKHTYMEHLA